MLLMTAVLGGNYEWHWYVCFSWYHCAHHLGRNLPQSCCMTLSTLQRFVLRSEEVVK